MGQVFHRNPKHKYPVAVGGDGPYVIDRDGKRYLDACGGAAVSCLGHGDREVIEAIKAQLDQLPFAHTSFFTNKSVEALSCELVEGAPAGIERVYFGSGGSEAVEAALRLARQYFVEIGQAQRRHVIGRRQSYHGNTLGALAAGGNPWRRMQFEPLLVEVSYVSPCYTYRGKQPGEGDAAYGLRLVRERGAGLEAGLRARFGTHPHVGEIRGRGLFWALELVEDRASKRPFDPKRRISARLKLGALENELMCYPMGGALDAVSGRPCNARPDLHYQRDAAGRDCGQACALNR
jgi:adenosylmethionine-8-amino-7-oxononanoate aminotransferase